MWLAFILATLLLIGFYIHHKQKPRRDAVANIPGPYSIPLLGSVGVLYKLNPQNLFGRTLSYGHDYGYIIKGWALNRLIVASADTKLNEQLLASQQHLVKHRNYKILHQWLGNSLLLSDGKKWFMRRKITTPAFHFQILEQFVEVFDQQWNIFVERLSEKADGKTPFDVHRSICLATLDIIAETAMGTKINAQSEVDSEYAIAVNKLTKLMAYRFLNVHLNNELIFSLLCPHLKWKQMQLIKTTHAFSTKVIEERRQKLEESLASKQNPKNDDDLGKKKRMALLDILLQSTIEGKPLTNEDIREEVDTFMFEGHDTTTSALCFTLHLLSRHPEVQNKLLTELQTVLGNDVSQPVTLHDLNELKYTELVIKESLRLYAPVPIIGREIDTDFKYTHPKLGDGIIPAGTEFLIFLYGMLRFSKYFKNSTEFQPERLENNEKMSAYSLIPFSAGPRNCIGQKFAMLEMKTMLAKTIRAYELLPLGEPVKPELNIVLRSSTGFQIGLRKREV